MLVVLRGNNETSHADASLSMSAVVEEYERCNAQTLTDIWHQDPVTIVEWMVADDPAKATEIWRLLGEQLGLSVRTENQPQPDEAEARYNLPIIDKARGWDTWHRKLAWLDGLSFEDQLREGPALLSDFDDWIDQVLGITPAWKKRRYPQTTRFIADAQVSLNFGFAVHLRAISGLETDR
jgi:hypothetical protein